jgi:c-di-GMP-binding flagellar brake protein YcgR
MTSPIAESGSGPALTQQAVTELVPLDEFSQYLLGAKSEMYPVFRGLVQHASLITMIFHEGLDMVLTSLLRYGDNGLIFEYGASSEMNRKVLQADKVFCDAQLEKVKIQFILHGVNHVEVDGRPAFHAALPDRILRLQRREHYRLATPVARPLICNIPFPSIDGSIVPVTTHVADISGGGVCLAGLPLELPLETDMELPGCCIELPEVGSVSVILRLRSVTETANRGGTRAKRAGCEFVDMSGQMAKLIQRYIMKVERERKARESGMA